MAVALVSFGGVVVHGYSRIFIAKVGGMDWGCLTIRLRRGWEIS